jgi:hypothetical protein
VQIVDGLAEGFTARGVPVTVIVIWSLFVQPFPSVAIREKTAVAVRLIVVGLLSAGLTKDEAGVHE